MILDVFWRTTNPDGNYRYAFKQFDKAQAQLLLERIQCAVDILQKDPTLRSLCYYDEPPVFLKNIEPVLYLIDVGSKKYFNKDMNFGVAVSVIPNPLNAYTTGPGIIRTGRDSQLHVTGAGCSWSAVVGIERFSVATGNLDRSYLSHFVAGKYDDTRATRST
jgi:hypothetical protein